MVDPTMMQADPLAEYGPTDGKVIRRDVPTPEEPERLFVANWLDVIARAKKHWDGEKGVYKEMRDSISFARGMQWSKDKDDTRYVANLTRRHINQRVSQIYARNPKIAARRKPRMEFEIWDGDPEKIQGARAVLGEAQPGEVPLEMRAQAQALLDDFQRGMTERARMNRIARTLEYVAQYSLEEPTPKFKTQLKQLLRRVETCKVGFIKLGYQRIFKLNAELDARVKDATERIARMEQLAADVADGVADAQGKELEELKHSLAEMQKQKQIIQREGVIFDFPRAWNVIIDPGVTQLKGFVGARWIAQEYKFSPDQVKQIFGVDLGTSYRTYDGRKAAGDSKDDDKKACLYEVHDLQSGLCFTLADGYPCYVKAPAAPDVTLDQGHPFYALTFNDVEDDENPYPPSEVETLKPMQMEHNRTREGMRQHRIANRPALVGPAGLLSEEDKRKLGNHQDNEFIELAIPPTTDMSKAIVPKPSVPIDPNLYNTGPIFEDILRSTGDQEASLGGTSGSTATEVGVAENTRATSISSDVDDLDEFLTDVMRGVGQILLAEMSAQTVKKIVGPGAAWPELSREEIANEIYLEIKAGSSGRPNRTVDLQTMEKVMPIVLQVPGVKPEPMAEKLLQLMDSSIEVADFIDPGLPSMTAMNGMKGPMEGAAGASGGSAAQGPAGARNTPQPGRAAAQTQNSGGTAPAPRAGAPV